MYLLYLSELSFILGQRFSQRALSWNVLVLNSFFITNGFSLIPLACLRVHIVNTCFYMINKHIAYISSPVISRLSFNLSYLPYLLGGPEWGSLCLAVRPVTCLWPCHWKLVLSPPSPPQCGTRFSVLEGLASLAFRAGAGVLKVSSHVVPAPSAFSCYCSPEPQVSLLTLSTCPHR